MKGAQVRLAVGALPARFRALACRPASGGLASSRAGSRHHLRAALDVDQASSSPRAPLLLGERGVQPAGGDQLVVGAALDHAALVEHQDLVAARAPPRPGA